MGINCLAWFTQLSKGLHWCNGVNPPAVRAGTGVPSPRNVQGYWLEWTHSPRVSDGIAHPESALLFLSSPAGTRCSDNWEERQAAGAPQKEIYLPFQRITIKAGQSFSDDVIGIQQCKLINNWSKKSPLISEWPLHTSLCFLLCPTHVVLHITIRLFLKDTGLDKSFLREENFMEIGHPGFMA